MIEHTNTMLNDYEIVIAYFCGDTPISNALCGVVESVANASFPCRHCLIKNTDIYSVKRGKDCKLRDIADFDILDNENPPKRERIELGIKRISAALNTTLINPLIQTPGDIMHNILEGICRKQALKIIKLWVKSKRASFDELKACIDSFNYDKHHRPNRMKNLSEHDLKKKDLIISASQMKTLFLLFPFIFQNIIDLDNEEYK